MRRAVTVAGAHSEGLLISSGLTGNERVVAIAGAFLRTGEAVQVAPGNLASGGGSGGGGADANGKRNATSGAANAVVSAP